jgi:3',5'-cyclic AMP phosphodiesterase CpdA
MRKLVHVSDLHFGKVGRETVAALEGSIRALDPDVLVVSGDLTQRARTQQFREAAEFLQRFDCAQVVVPGNHDLPFFNLAARFKTPFTKYATHIHPDIEPFYEDEEVVVVGISTPQPRYWTRGELTSASLEKVKERLSSATNKVKILVSHHPLEIFQPGPGRQLLDYEPDVLLAGHLHASSAAVTTTVHPHAHRSAILVQAGTSTSTRLRGEHNAFNLLQVERNRMVVVRYTSRPGGGAFTAVNETPFVLAEEGWEGGTASAL